MISPAHRLDSIQEYYFSAKLKQIAALNTQGASVINLGIGSPDLPPHPAVIQKLCESAQNPNKHSYQNYIGIPSLRVAFADFYRHFFSVELNFENEILPLIGSKEGIMHIAMAFLSEGDHVLVPNPGYPTYRAASLLTGAKVIDYSLHEENNWLPDWAEIERQDLSKVKMIWINYPNMPTGRGAEEDFWVKAIDFAKRNSLLIVNDNPYSFIRNKKYKSPLALSGAKEVVLELTSLSKSHNMAGWRVGAVLGKPEFIQTILRFKSNMDSGMFLPVQEAAVVALSSCQEDWFSTLNDIYFKREKIVFALLNELKCHYEKNQTGLFVWAKVPKRFKNGYEMSDYILEKARVFITPGGIFGSNGSDFIRVSLCSSEKQLEESAERIRKNY